MYQPDFLFCILDNQSTELPSFVINISSASSCARVAAAAGELAKDEKHQDFVEEAGRS